MQTFEIPLSVTDVNGSRRTLLATVRASTLAEANTMALEQQRARWTTVELFITTEAEEPAPALPALTHDEIAAIWHVLPASTPGFTKIDAYMSAYRRARPQALPQELAQAIASWNRGTARLAEADARNSTLALHGLLSFREHTYRVTTKGIAAGLKPR